MQETILRDGEVAILMGDVQVIMNENTVLSLLEKFGLIEKVKEPEATSDILGKITVAIGQVGTPVAAPKQTAGDVYPISKQTNIPQDGHAVLRAGRCRPIMAFVYDKDAVDKTGNRYSGFKARYKYFDSAKEAEEYFDLSSGRVSAIARTWEYIVNDSWKKGIKSNPQNQVAWKDSYSGTYSWYNTPYSFTANTPHGTMAFMYIDSIPADGNKKTFIV